MQKLLQKTIYDYIAGGTKIGVNVTSTIILRILQTSFETSKKTSDAQNWVQKLIVKEKEITDPKIIPSNIKTFCEILFK